MVRGMILTQSHGAHGEKCIKDSVRSVSPCEPFLQVRAQNRAFPNWCKYQKLDFKKTLSPSALT